MAFSESEGSNIAISASAPATQDEAGFKALTYTGLTYITDLPGFGETRTTNRTATLDAGELLTAGVSQKAEATLTFVADPADAGQELLIAAYEGRTLASIRVTLANGVINYFQAAILSANEAASTGTTVQLTAGIAVRTNLIRVKPAAD